MSDKTVSVEESFAKWREDEDYREAYDALEDEFALASALIRAQLRVG